MGMTKTSIPKRVTGKMGTKMGMIKMGTTKRVTTKMDTTKTGMTKRVTTKRVTTKTGMTKTGDLIMYDIEIRQNEVYVKIPSNQ